MSVSLIIITLIGVVVGIISLTILKIRKALTREEFDLRHQVFYFEMGLHEGHQRNLLIRNSLYIMYVKACDNLVEKHFDIDFAYSKLMQNEDFLEKISFYQNPIKTYIG